MTELGAPPGKKVFWDIVTKDGRKLEGFGQTAYNAAASKGLLLEQVESITPRSKSNDPSKMSP